jgi:hypothetical protein
MAECGCLSGISCMERAASLPRNLPVTPPLSWHKYDSPHHAQMICLTLAHIEFVLFRSPNNGISCSVVAIH